MSNPDVQLLRARRKLLQRDARIAGLQRRIAALEHALATANFNAKEFPLDVRRAVQDALCNVRMIPVLGISGGNKIVEVRAVDPQKRKDEA